MQSRLFDGEAGEARLATKVVAGSPPALLAVARIDHQRAGGKGASWGGPPAEPHQ